LERAIALGQKEGAPVGALEDARFALARALWETRKDRVRAVQLATQARDGYARWANKKALSGVQDWLARTAVP
ncbi:MAG: hypothetical protein WBV82_07410, partial [Myxococcaceae bacterium]